MSYELIETDYNKSALIKKEETHPSLSKETKDDLMHYGVLGMRWGIRRYQPYGEGGYNPKKKGVYKGRLTAKGYQRDLNRMSKEVKRQEKKAVKSLKTFEKDNATYNRLKDKKGKIGKTLSEAAKGAATYDAMEAAKYNARADLAREYIQEISYKALKSGYKITSVDNVKNGKYYVVKKLSAAERKAQRQQIRDIERASVSATLTGNTANSGSNSNNNQSVNVSSSSQRQNIQIQPTGNARNRAKMMTDEQLKKAVERKTNEQKYISMSTSSVTDGKDYISELTTKTATTFVNTAVNKATTEAANELVGAGKNFIKEKLKK